MTAASIDHAALRGLHLFVGSPMYDGRCHAEFTFPLCQLSSLCSELGIRLQLFFFSGEALVMKARNTIADEFLCSGAQHLMMIDSDIGFDPRDVVTLLALQNADGGQNDFDAIAAPWPIKRIDWPKVVRAVHSGVGADNPADLAHCAGDVLVSPLHDRPYPLGEPLEVAQTGTGFMMIRRATLEAFRREYPHRRYRSGHFGVSERDQPVVTQFFESEVFEQNERIIDAVAGFVRANPAAGQDEIARFVRDLPHEPGEYVSEDFLFCRLLRRIGLKVWTCPWMNLTHTGSHTFTSRLSDLARIGLT